MMVSLSGAAMPANKQATGRKKCRGLSGRTPGHDCRAVEQADDDRNHRSFCQFFRFYRFQTKDKSNARPRRPRCNQFPLIPPFYSDRTCTFCSWVSRGAVSAGCHPAYPRGKSSAPCSSSSTYHGFTTAVSQSPANDGVSTSRMVLLQYPQGLDRSLQPVAANQCPARTGFRRSVQASCSGG